MKKAFASDFDNTLYFKDGFREKDLLAIERKQKEGLLFGVCTGRSLYGVLVPVKERIHFDFYILATGSLILDSRKDPIFSKTIDIDAVLRITQEYQEKYHLAYNCGDNFYSLFDEYEIVVQMKDLNMLPSHVYGISFLTESTAKAYEICQHLSAFYPVKAYNNGPFVDITANGCSKGEAILRLKKMMNIDFIYGMGDSYNDISMLEKVDTSFTFISSPELVQSKVDKITSSIHESLSEIEIE